MPLTRRPIRPIKKKNLSSFVANILKNRKFDFDYVLDFLCWLYLDLPSVQKICAF